MKISDKEHTQDGRNDAEKFNFAITGDATSEIISDFLMIDDDESTGYYQGDTSQEPAPAKF